MSWQIDKETLLAMRVQKIEQALQSNRPDDALVEAEELLDEHPDHPQGLLYCGQAALLMGACHTARTALQFCVSKCPDEPLPRTLLARAQFECGYLEQASTTAKESITMDPQQAAAWFIRGLVLERTEAPDAAVACFAQAEHIAPGMFPPPLVLTKAQWEREYKKALRVIPPAFQVFFSQIPLVWAQFPDPEILQPHPHPISPLIGAMLTGRPPQEHQDPWQHLPESLVLFKGNLRHSLPPDSDLLMRISQALLNEALAWTRTAKEDVLTD